MDEEPTVKKAPALPRNLPEEGAARKAQAAAEAKAEELRAALQSKGEQGKSSLGDLPVDPDEEG
jgi:hypothetical protein